MAGKELAVTYQIDDEEMTITADDVRNIIAKNQNVTDQEVRLFLELCKAQKLNPFIREAYLVKYANNPATILTGKEVFTKRAQRNALFEGYEAGVTIIGTDGGLHRREGSMILPGEQLVGGWCKVYVKGYKCPMYDEVSYDEYVGRKQGGAPNQQWATKPGTMIRKVAIVHALREAFPDDLQGMYDASEMGNLEPQQAQTIEVPVYEPVPVDNGPQTASEALESAEFDVMEEF